MAAPKRTGSPKLKTAVRRRQIAEAALEAVAAGGVKGLSIAGIARRTGMDPSNVYRHFRDKNEILRTVLEYLGERLQGLVAGARDGSPLGRLRAILLGHMDMVGTFPSLPLLLFSEEVFHGEPPLREGLRAQLSAYFDALAGVAREAQEAGEIRKELKPEQVALAVFGTVMPGVILWHLTGGRFDLRALAEEQWALCERALTPKGPAPARRRRKPRKGAKKT